MHEGWRTERRLVLGTTDSEVEVRKRLMEILNSLARLRLKRGLTASQLAAAVGVCRQTIYAPVELLSRSLFRLIPPYLTALFRLIKSPPMSA